MKITSLMLPLAGAGLALALTACGPTTTAGNGTPSQVAESSTANTQASVPATSATASATVAETSEATASATAEATGSAQATETAQPRAVPSPTVVELDQATSETDTSTQVPVPTGTVVTIAPNAEPAAEPTSNTAAAAQAPSSAAGVAVCDYGQIYIAAAVTEGAAGSKYINLTFTNTGNSNCAMSGYPSVHYVDSAGHQIGAAAARATEWSANGTVLSPGASTTATLRETRAQLYGETCQSAPAAGYSVQAPGASQPLVLNFAAEACSNNAINQLSVGAVGATP